jgi:WD40 repeat protein
MAFIANGTRIIGIDRDNANSLVICDTQSGERLATWSSGAGPVQVLATDRSGRIITWATAAGDKAVDIHWRDRESGEQPDPIRLEARGLVALAIDPVNGQLAALTGHTRESGEQSVWAFDLSGAIPPKEVIRSNQMTGGLSFSPDGSILAVSDGDAVYVYRACKWNQEFRIPAPASTTCLTFSSDGRRLAAVGYDGNATLIDPIAGKRVFQLRSLADRRPDEMAADARVAFSPDGSYLLSTNWDGSINVWDGSPTQP